MAELPTGTVTMLFSDIEGSTKLLSRLGDEYADALSRQRSVLRSAWQTWNGVEMGTEGDSFFVVFGVARDAVHAALEAQQALLAATWPRGEQVAVRMGLHTGEPTRHEDGYIGMDVHRAARVAGVANGGQIVLTDATSTIVRGSLPDGARLDDLGHHRLKDMPTPEHLFQVTADRMRPEFPPLRSLGTTTSLPRPRTPLIGRDAELAQLTALVTDAEVRLLTLTGPGGTGKTRLSVSLAHAVADGFPDGIYFVPLAAATSTEAMWATLADKLGVDDDPTPERVISRLEHRRILLVLDNLEQLVGAANVVEALLDGVPALTVVATSRGPLHVSGEHEHVVPPLTVPEDSSLQTAQEAAAVQLFCQHAQRVRSDFALAQDNVADVVAICRRLDGLPLAIEITAARSKLLSPSAALSRLSTVLETESTDVTRPARQRSLRDAIAWSQDLLDSDKQEFFRRLGVFPGPADLDAIAAVTAGPHDVIDDLSALVDVSLVRVVDTPDGEPRFTLLQTVRDFAVDALARAGELDDVRRRHAEHYLALAERTAPLLTTARQLDAVDRLELEHDNLRAALTWSLRPGEGEPSGAAQAAIGVQLCAALWWFWASQGHVTAGRAWFDRAAAVASEEDSPAMARVLLGIGVWKAWEIDYVAGRHGESDDPEGTAPPELERSLAMARRWGDLKTMAEAAVTLAQCHHERGRLDEARQDYERSIGWSERSGDDACRASCLHHYAWLVFEEGDYERAAAMVEGAREISARLGDERDVLARSRQLVQLSREAGDVQRALADLTALVPDVLRVRQPALSISVLGTFAEIFMALGEPALEVQLTAARNHHHRLIGWPESVVMAWEQSLTGAHETLGDEAFEAAYAKGRVMTLPEALTLAVSRATGDIEAP
jgi:predicted ATPase/class 3 adenylate cyclase